MAAAHPGVEQFIQHLRSYLAESTCAGYIRWVERFDEWFRRSGRELTDPRVLVAFSLHLLQPGEYAPPKAIGLKPESVGTALHPIRQYLKYLREEGVEVADQRTVRLPPSSSKVKWTPREKAVCRLVDVAWEYTQPYGMIAIILPFTGLRVSEALALADDDVRLEEDGSLVFTIRKPKNRKDREVPLPDEGFLHIGHELLLRYVRDVRPSLGGHPKWLFPADNSGHVSQRKGHVKRKTMEKHLRKIRVEAGLPENATHHGLRRFYVTHRRRNGVPADVVARIIGHTDMSTFDRYYQPSVEDLIESLKNAERTTHGNHRRRQEPTEDAAADGPDTAAE